MHVVCLKTFVQCILYLVQVVAKFVTSSQLILIIHTHTHTHMQVFGSRWLR